MMLLMPIEQFWLRCVPPAAPAPHKWSLEDPLMEGGTV